MTSKPRGELIRNASRSVLTATFATWAGSTPRRQVRQKFGLRLVGSCQPRPRRAARSAFDRRTPLVCSERGSRADLAPRPALRARANCRRRSTSPSKKWLLIASPRRAPGDWPASNCTNRWGCARRDDQESAAPSRTQAKQLADEHDQVLPAHVPAQGLVLPRHDCGCSRSSCRASRSSRLGQLAFQIAQADPTHP